MRTSPAWRRCPTCGQLSLIASAPACSACGAPMPTSPAAPGRPSVRRHAVPRARRGPAPQRPPLDPTDDVVAKRLLATVFPDGDEI